MERDDDLTAVLFDFDGTLFDLDLDLRPWRAEAAAPGSTSTVEDLLRSAEGGERDRLDGLLAAAEYVAVERGCPRPGALETLRRLQPFRLGVVSRNFHATVDAGIRKIGFRGAVTVIGREDVARPKPDPEGVAAALNRLGTPPSRAVLVGDTFHDVEAGHRGGVRVVIVTNPKLRFTPCGADAYVSSLVDLIDLLEPA
jgi:HAD superfamily hydrolase (TIGR01509 family)